MYYWVQMSYIYCTNARTIDTLSNKKLKCLEFIDSFKLEQDAQKSFKTLRIEL